MKKGIDLMEAKNSTWGKVLSILIAIVMAISVFTPISIAFVSGQAAAAVTESSVCPKADDGKHNYTGETKVDIPATCTESGYSGAKTCKHCGAIDPTHSGTEIKPLGHDVKSDKAIEPTCTKPGQTAGEHCIRCDYKTTEVLDASGHDFIIAATEATCGKTGSIITTCSRCDFESIEILDALVHNFSKWEVAKKATCQDTGEKVRTCSRCGYSEYEQIDVLGHHMVTVEAVAPTCTTPGLTEGMRCVRESCGYIEAEQTEIAKLPHEFTNYVETTAPTCTKKGKKEAICDLCHEATDTKEISSLGHTEIVDKAVKATCTETGLAEGKHCSVCGEVTVPQEEVAALGHNFDGLVWDDDCDSHEAADCTTHTKLCKNCNGKLDGGKQTETHRYAPWWVLEKPATKDEAGSQSLTCVDCGHKIIQEIPKLGTVTISVQFVDEDGYVVKVEDPIELETGRGYDVSDLVDNIPDGYEANGEPYGADVSGVADANKTINVPVKKVVVEQPATPSPTPGPTNPTPGTPQPTPAPTPAPNVLTPIATPFAPIVAPAAAPAAPAAADEATIEDDANPLAEAPEEQVIEDEENALAGFDDPHCWTHWLMIFGATATIVYCGCVIVRRRNSIKKFDDFENEVLGIGEKRTAGAAQRRAAYNAYQSI